MIQVPFHGDVIEAKQDGADVWVPLKRPCEALGLLPHGQAEKLKDMPWANTQMICVLDAAGRKFEMFALHLKSFPMWLATINPRKVKAEVRAKLGSNGDDDRPRPAR